jgi:hypothetical protein
LKSETEIERTGTVWAAFWLAFVVIFAPCAWLASTLFNFLTVGGLLIGGFLGALGGYLFARSKIGPVIADKFIECCLWLAWWT